MRVYDIKLVSVLSPEGLQELAQAWKEREDDFVYVDMAKQGNELILHLESKVQVQQNSKERAMPLLPSRYRTQ